MSRLTVTYSPAAEREMIEAWLAAADRNGVTAAEAEIDRLLSRNPLGAGRELHEGLRELIVPPLRVLFSASPDDLTVEVAAVRLLPGEARADRHGSNGRPGD